MEKKWKRVELIGQYINACLSLFFTPTKLQFVFDYVKCIQSRSIPLSPRGPWGPGKLTLFFSILLPPTTCKIPAQQGRGGCLYPCHVGTQ